jgi:hypothetical protein
MRIVMAAALYFVGVFAVGFLLGPIRVLWLEPRLGTTIAVLCETPFLVAAMVAVARWVSNKLHVSGHIVARAAMGGVALVLQAVADGVVGIGLRGVTPAEQLAYFSTPAGLIYAAALLAFAAMPVLVNRDLATARRPSERR